MGSDKKAVQIWIEESKGRLRTDLPHTTPVVRYWRLEQFSCVAVHRDREWFQRVLPKITSFWHEVTYYRSIDPVQLYRDYNKTMPVNVDIVDEGGNDGADPPAFLSDSDSEENNDTTTTETRRHADPRNNVFLPDSDEE